MGSVHIDLSLSVTKLSHIKPDLVPDPPVPPGRGRAGDACAVLLSCQGTGWWPCCCSPSLVPKGVPPETRTGSLPLAPQLNGPAVYNLNNPTKLSHGHMSRATLAMASSEGFSQEEGGIPKQRDLRSLLGPWHCHPHFHPMFPA